MMNMSQNGKCAICFRNIPGALSDDALFACGGHVGRAVLALACTAQPSPKGRPRHTEPRRQLLAVALVFVQPLLQRGR